MPTDRLVKAYDLTSRSALIGMIVTHISNQDSLIGSEAANPASHSAPIEWLQHIYPTKTASLAKSLETPLVNQHLLVLILVHIISVNNWIFFFKITWTSVPMISLFVTMSKNFHAKS